MLGWCIPYKVSSLDCSGFEKPVMLSTERLITGKYTDGDEFDKGGGLASLAKSVKSLGFSKGGKWEVEGTVRFTLRFPLLTRSSHSQLKL